MKPVVVVISILILISSCEGKIENPATGTLDTVLLMPLEPGNQWVYEVEGNQFYSQITHLVESVAKYQYQDTQIDMYYIVADYGIGTYAYYYYYHEDAFNHTLHWKIEPDNPTYCFKYPVERGDEWENEFILEYTNEYLDEYRLVSKHSRVTVPAGTFQCYEYEIERTGITNDGYISRYRDNYYFKPGIGMVAHKHTVINLDNPNDTSVYWMRRLESYSIN